MVRLLAAVLAEPRVAGAPRRVWRDWVVVGVSSAVAILEALFRRDVPWRWLTFVLAVALIAALLWRRTHPLHVVVACFGGMFALSLADLVTNTKQSTGLYAMTVLIVSLYALNRWGSGREMLIGNALALATAAVAIAADWTGIGDAIGGLAFLEIVAAFGLTVRYNRRAREREHENVRSTERERLARDLHDTVAHHVSAIAIRAQAGIAVAPTEPAAAVDALRVIEAEASRTLAEMRGMVGVLRRDLPAEYAPTPGLADLHQLAGDDTGGLRVEVDIQPGLEVSPAVATTLYRLAQESITNARRHARNATRARVRVRADASFVRLDVSDDGDPVSGRPVAGYGVIGMTERASLFGGQCTVGPAPGGGWRVEAHLPRHATTNGELA